MSKSDAESSDRGVDAPTPEIVYKIHNLVMVDRKLKVREIVSTVNISSERIQNILN